MPEAKIMHFVREGHKINGVIHIGMSWGEEIQFYKEMGIENIVGCEPLTRSFSQCVELFGRLPGVKLYQQAFSDRAGVGVLQEFLSPDKNASGERDTGGSSFLGVDRPTLVAKGYEISDIPTPYERFDAWIGKHPEIDMSAYDCLVLDVQGMELEVLKGLGKYLTHFRYFNIECSEVPIFDGEASAKQVIDYLASFGIVQETSITPHDDIMFFNTK